MKTINNYQKSETWGTIRKSLLAVVALTLISFYLFAPNFFNHLSYNDLSKPLAMRTGVSCSNETKNDSPAIKFEPEHMENLKIESWMKNYAKTDNEVVKAELSLQTEVLMNINEYNSEKFVEAEMKLEIESWLNSTSETERLPQEWNSEPNRSFILKTYFN